MEGMVQTMKKKQQKRILLYVCLAVVLVVAIAGYRMYRHQAEQKSTKEAEQNVIKSVDDLTGKKIGVQIGTTGDIYASDYEKDGKGTSVERFNKGADAVQALKVGKINCVIIDEQPAKEYVKKNTELKILKEEFANEEYAICIGKENPELKEKINGALRELKEEKVIQQITDYYIGKDSVKEKNPYKKKDVKRNNGTLSVATNAEFPPYEYFDKGKITGIDADIMQAICDKL